MLPALREINSATRAAGSLRRTRAARTSHKIIIRCNEASPSLLREMDIRIAPSLVDDSTRVMTPSVNRMLNI